MIKLMERTYKDVREYAETLPDLRGDLLPIHVRRTEAPKRPFRDNLKKRQPLSSPDNF